MRISNIKDIGELIRKHRKAHDLTLETASGLANVSIRFLSEIERGKETAEIGKVFQVLRKFGLDVDIKKRGSDS